jgi:hypothetical protein
MTGHRIYKASFRSVYPHYVAKAEKKGRTKQEVDQIIRWLSGYSQQGWKWCWKMAVTSNASSSMRPVSTHHAR